MGTGTRLALLMLMAILGKYDPHRPPGGRSGVPAVGVGIAPCPLCDELSDTKPGNLFWCEDCRIWFDSDGNIHR